MTIENHTHKPHPLEKSRVLQFLSLVFFCTFGCATLADWLQEGWAVGGAVVGAAIGTAYILAGWLRRVRAT